MDICLSNEKALLRKAQYAPPKLRNNAEIEKLFWMINAVQLINKGICRVNQQVQNYKTCLKNRHFGVEKFNFSLGLSFNFFCIDIILLSVYWLNESFFGIYCLINLFVFSIDPFCHEQYGSAKYTGTPKYFVMSLCAANSGPLSVVIVFR